MNGTQHIGQEELALHAIQALPGTDREIVRMHLAECGMCREELAALNGDLALLALTVARRPVPQGARQRFMQKLAAVGPVGGLRPSASLVPIDRVQARRRSALLPWAAVAALLLLAGGLGMRIKQLSDQLRLESLRVARLAETNRQLTETNAHAHEVLELMTAPNAQRATLMPTAKAKMAPMGQASYLAESGVLMFQGSHLAHLPEGKTYQLWLMPANGHAPMPAGMFTPDAAGNASVMMPMLPKGISAKAFGVTIENAGGAETPTMPIVLSGAASTAGE